jgi:DNA modification methylase
MGSGSVGAAALAEGRRFIGCEINADWSARASARLLDVNLDMFHGPA